jgi:2,5-furandicarboxylate decarboxylase 1
MSLKRVKHVVVTDDDIDIFDPAQLERALAYRVQPARDIIVVEGARGSHLDPSVQLPVGKGPLAPLTAKWGVDATIPEGSDLSEYEAIAYPFAEDAGKDAPRADRNISPEALAAEIAARLDAPRHFADILKFFEDVPHRTIVQAWTILREADRLDREVKTGRYVLKRET